MYNKKYNILFSLCSLYSKISLFILDLFKLLISSFSINTDIVYNEKSILMNKSSKFLEKIDEEFLSYDDQVSYDFKLCPKKYTINFISISNFSSFRLNFFKNHRLFQQSKKD
jgi:hypothetical protein